ncbi:MAG: sigma-E processing peptidase SpoIIGA [Acutalibacteraceae bacterium]|nr:sigma-E processing peptidase SpoIIGA [Acutalibacteraceae bacterium]
MVVYADILVILNLIVDYFLLSASAAILRVKLSVFRQLASAAVGAFSSLYVFAPDLGLFFDLVFKAVICAVMVLCAFGFGGAKRFFRSAGVLFLVTCGFGGIMTAVWIVFRPKGMTVVNPVVYFNISPAVLIGASVITYLLFMLMKAIFSRTSELADRCEITVTAEEKSITMDAIVDTGNSIKDYLSGSEVIIADGEFVKVLLGSDNPVTDIRLKKRYRILPLSTVSGGGTLDGFRCDSAVISDGERTVKLEKPILAVSKTPLRDDYQAIVNPEIFI